MKYAEDDLYRGDFKSILDATLFYRRIISLDSQKRIQYLGLAAPETKTSSARWLIHRYTYDGSTDNLLTDDVADHDASFSKEWDDRTKYGYRVADIVVAADSTLELYDSTSGETEEVAITAGTYSMSKLATTMQTRINANAVVVGWSGATGWTVVYSADTRKFTITTPHISKTFIVKTNTFGAQIGFVSDSSAGLTCTSDTAQTEV